MPLRTVAHAATTDLLVTTTADVANGDTSSVASLLANPGPDGVSLREAIAATNGDVGAHTIRFAPSLKGATIALTSELAPILGGSLTVEGDMDGDGRPDITLAKAPGFSRTYCPNDAQGCGIEIASSGNRVHALALVAFGIGVAIEDWQARSDVPPTVGRTISNNVISGLVMRQIRSVGVYVGPDYNTACGLFSGHVDPCRTGDTWADTTISGNTIESGKTGIGVKMSNAGDRISNFTVTDNVLSMSGTDEGVGFEVGGNATGVVMSGIVIARNTVNGRVDIGINVAAGANRAAANVIDGVQVSDNKVQLISQDAGFCCQGIVVQAGSDAPDAIFPNVLPLAYADRNETRNVLVRGNTVGGTLVWGIAVQTGLGAGGSANSVHDVQIERNTIASSTLSPGILIMTAGGGPPLGGRYPTGNEISRVSASANRITIGRATGTPTFAASGVLLIGGGAFGRDGAVRDVQLVNDVIGPGPAAVVLIGGDEGATGNRVENVQLMNDTIFDPTGTALQLIANNNPSKGTAANSVSSVAVSNTILWGGIRDEVTSSMIATSIVEDASFAAANGNVSADPGFVDPSNGDFHLLPGSPAVDAGAAPGAPTADFDGTPRSDGHIDVGAFEYRTRTPVVASCGNGSGATVEDRIRSFWLCVDGLASADRLAAADLGQWARNVIERDPAAGLRVGDFRASTTTMQGAIDRASAGIPSLPPTASDVEQRIASFWARIDALGTCDLVTATDLGGWALNVINRDPSRQIRVDDFRATTAAMQAALERSASPCP